MSWKNRLLSAMAGVLALATRSRREIPAPPKAMLKREYLESQGGARPDELYQVRRRRRRLTRSRSAAQAARRRHRQLQNAGRKHARWGAAGRP